MSDEQKRYCMICGLPHPCEHHTFHAEVKKSNIPDGYILVPINPTADMLRPMIGPYVGDIDAMVIWKEILEAVVEGDPS